MEEHRHTPGAEPLYSASQNKEGTTSPLEMNVNPIGYFDPFREYGLIDGADPAELAEFLRQDYDELSIDQNFDKALNTMKNAPNSISGYFVDPAEPHLALRRNTDTRQQPVLFAIPGQEWSKSPTTDMVNSREKTRSDSLVLVSETKILNVLPPVAVQHSEPVAMLSGCPKSKPKTDPTHFWVRINQKTKGSNRTSKINNFDPSQVYDRIDPPGSWVSKRGFRFTYNEHGELARATMSAEEMLDFVSDNPHKLKMWIQRAPADSARRYPTPSLSRCRFANCPSRKSPGSTGSILHGHYRVAFDEICNAQNRGGDPFLVSFYVHLYCLERFLDFAEICSRYDVKEDTRNIPTEPKGRFAAALNQGEGSDGHAAKDFVEAIRKRSQRKWSSPWRKYPEHSQFQDGSPKPHDKTLCYHMHISNEAARPKTQAEALERRGKNLSHVRVHLGDLEMFVSGRVNARVVKRKHEATIPQTQLDNSLISTANEPSTSNTTKMPPERESNYQSKRTKTQ